MSVVSDSVRPHRRQPTRLPRPWDSPGKNTRVGCHFRQCMKVKSESEVAQSCLTLWDPMDCSNKYHQKVKKQFSKNMMEMQLSEGRLDGASKNKWEKKDTPMPIHLWQEQSMFKWLKISAGFLWWNSKWWGIHTQWPQFSQISRQRTVGDKFWEECRNGSCCIYSSIFFNKLYLGIILGS